MFSLQSHNQVLYHLTQLTSTITPLSSSLVTKSKTHRRIPIQKNEIVCEESLREVAKNIADLQICKVPTHYLSLPMCLKQREALDFLDYLSNGSITKFHEFKRRWNVSYTSGNSFNDNKRELLLKPFLTSQWLALNTQYRFLHKSCHKQLTNNLLQVRHFKTERTFNFEQERNPTFTHRLKKLFKLPSAETGKGPVIPEMQGEDLERLKHVLESSELPQDPEARMRLQVAFAEGYMAAVRAKPATRGLKILKFLQYSVAIMILIILSTSLFGSLKSASSGGMFKIQLGRHIEVDPEEIHVTFNDVRGVEEAKQELRDVVEFLKNPEKFTALGGKLPKGVLLVGPPGTGKTLLARAVAGEAGVPFFHAAGPEFDEVLVGQGARRVRDLFKAAKERAPCVIFIDEIDSVGARRTNSVLHPYANQTINQLLSEMDGFHQNEGVIVLGATNRRDDLDKALMRPGRFDVEIYVQVPDYDGRREILDLYLARILTRDVNTDLLARNTIGFTGADIENMINQAALRAAIDGAEFVTMGHLDYARDKVILGPDRKKKVADEQANLITAYHEAGHALVAYYTKEARPIHKITIIPRGPSLGSTSYIPDKDTYHVTKAELLAIMDACMGGRAAEEMTFGPEKITTGASSDFKQATQIAENMVKMYGMSEKVGFRTQSQTESYFGNGNDYSPGTADLIDAEVKRILQESYERAKTILKTHSKELKLLSEALIKHETLDSDDMKAIINGKKMRKEVVTPTPNRTIVDVPTNVVL